MKFNKAWGREIYAEMGTEGADAGGASEAGVKAADPLFDSTGATGVGDNTGGDSTKQTASEGEGGKQGNPVSTNWKDSLPDDMKDKPFLKNINNLETLVKSFEHAQSMVGAEKVAIPSKNAGPEEWTEVFKKLGLPDEENYNLGIENDEANKDYLEKLKPVFYKNGVLPHQAKEIVQSIMNADKEAFEKYQETMNNQQAEGLLNLKKEWGSAYGEELSKAKAALTEFTDEETRAAIRESGLGSNPSVIKLLAKVGATLSEDKILGEGGTANGLPTPAQAREESKTIMGDKEHAYWNPENPGHAEAKKKVGRLFEIAASGNA